MPLPSVDAARLTPQVIDAYVWPESMYSATNPYVFADVDVVVPPQFPGTPTDFENSIRRQQMAFTQRANFLQSNLRRQQPDAVENPELIVGCGVVEYGQEVDVYSAVLNINADHRVDLMVWQDPLGNVWRVHPDFAIHSRIEIVDPTRHGAASR